MTCSKHCVKMATKSLIDLDHLQNSLKSIVKDALEQVDVLKKNLEISEQHNTFLAQKNKELMLNATNPSYNKDLREKNQKLIDEFEEFKLKVNSLCCNQCLTAINLTSKVMVQKESEEISSLELDTQFDADSPDFVQETPSPTVSHPPIPPTKPRVSKIVLKSIMGSSTPVKIDESPVRDSVASSGILRKYVPGSKPHTAFKRTLVKVSSQTNQNVSPSKKLRFESGLINQTRTGMNLLFSPLKGLPITVSLMNQSPVQTSDKQALKNTHRISAETSQQVELSTNSRSNLIAMSVKAIGCFLMHRNDETETSSSSSDEEWETILQNYNRKKRREKLRRRFIHYEDLNFLPSDEEFKNNFRLSRNTFHYLHDLIKEDLVRKVSGCPTIPSYQQLMIALWKLATLDCYGEISDRFDVGRATAVRAVRRVCHSLFRRASRFIQWPTEDRAIDVMRGFERENGFPKTIGAIDGTHIRIKAPKQNSVDYMNRYGFHSIQLQLVCDHKSLITHCDVGHPGSVDDQKVFRLSEVADYLNDDDKFPENSHILGDGAYEIHEHLLTPYRDNGILSAKQRKYNYHHAAARLAVERCIKLLKVRMRGLSDGLRMRRVDLMTEFIVACCVIHNICILREDDLFVIAIPESYQENNEIYPCEVYQTAGVIKRDLIMNSL